ncbi:MAG: nitrophenyl compound nitroreductase subunit ArsF family protein [Phycisphaerae bacterium]|nr:nitrophenyl compound nitroreductase subunit ArsF family protein [Phycisphaerae bacterium]
MAIRCFLLIAACLSCLGCRAADPSNPKDPVSSANDSPAAGTQTQSAAGSTVVYAYYFHQTFRCLSCQLMEETAARAIQENFAQPIQAGQVVWMPVNIDKPEGKVLRQQFHVRASELVLARRENGVCKESKKLDELSRLVDRPDAFSKYLVDEVNACLGAAGGR